MHKDKDDDKPEKNEKLVYQRQAYSAATTVIFGKEPKQDTLCSSIPVPQDSSFKFRASGDSAYQYLFLADNDPNSKDKKVRFMEVYGKDDLLLRRIDLRCYNIANVFNGQPFGKPIVKGSSIV